MVINIKHIEMFVIGAMNESVKKYIKLQVNYENLTSANISGYLRA